MPLLKPQTEFLDASEITEKEIAARIRNSGVLSPARARGEAEPNPVQELLEENGASLDETVKNLADIMKNGKFENSRLRATETALELHGVRTKEGKVQTAPIFNVFIKSDKVNINGIFDPISDRESLQIIEENNDLLHNL